MAQIDTGLGWNAKSNWLLSPSGPIAGISNIAWNITGYENQTIPVYVPEGTPDAMFIKNNGLYLGYIGNWRYKYEMHIMASKPGAIIGIGLDGNVGDTSRNRTYIICSEPCTVYVSQSYYDRDSYMWTAMDSAWGGDSGANVSEPVTLSGNTVYWNNPGIGSYGYPYKEINVPVLPFTLSWNDLTAYLDYNAVTYYKLNTGYAVACLARWYTPEGADLISPILISTVREYTIITTNGTTPAANMATYDFLYQGARFYMSLIEGNTAALSTTYQFADLRQFAAAAPSKVFALLASESYSNIIVSDAADPYEEQTGASEEDGGDGNEIVDEPILDDTHTVPTGGGFYKIYTPSLSQLGQLSQYMWGTLDVDNFKRIFSSPIDCILGLGIVPISLSGTSSPVYLGGVDTQLSFPLVTNEIYDFDMGYVHIEKATGSYLDYAPYTKISVYLPFIGFRELDADDVMDTYLTLKYRIDIATGACIARLSRMGTTLYQFSGSCLKQLPITGTNWDNAITGAISTAVAIGSTVATSGATAPVLAGAVASASTQALTTKSSTQRSGSMSATSGLLGGIVPYIVRTTPIEVIPANQNKYIGYPSYTTQSLGSISGYNEIASIHLEGIPATGDELAEIETLLKGGVIL